MSKSVDKKLRETCMIEKYTVFQSQLQSNLSVCCGSSIQYNALSPPYLWDVHSWIQTT